MIREQIAFWRPLLTRFQLQWELVDGPDALDLVTAAGPLSEAAAAQVQADAWPCMQHKLVYTLGVLM